MSTKANNVEIQLLRQIFFGGKQTKNILFSVDVKKV